MTALELRQQAIPAVYMRGGTSKGVFVLHDDLPEVARDAGPRRDDLLLRLMGSPDPYGTQIDGLGGATPSTSKVVIVRPSERSDHEIEYLFGAVGIHASTIDWSANCGNLTAAVAPFAIEQGLIDAGPDGLRTVRMWQANIGQTIVARVSVCQGRPVESGHFMLDGVAFPSSEVSLEFSGSAHEERTVPLFPTGHLIERIDVPEYGPVEVTLVTEGAPTVFVRAAALELTGAESREDLAARPDAVRALVHIRAEAAVRLNVVKALVDAGDSPHVPRVCFVGPSANYVASDGKTVSQDGVDVLARILSQGKLHHAMTGTGAVALAVAAAVPGTVVSEALKNGAAPRIRFGHPAGVLEVGAQVQNHGDAWQVVRVVMSRSARRLMAGVAFVPSGS